VIAIIDENDRVIFEKRLGNDLNMVLTALEPYRHLLVGLMVESTFN
jgi:transposase